MPGYATPAYHGFLSTPSVRRATPPESEGTMQAEISIHALREEGDRKGLATGYRGNAFLSTPSVRRATNKLLIKNQPFGHFYPRPP